MGLSCVRGKKKLDTQTRQHTVAHTRKTHKLRESNREKKMCVHACVCVCLRECEGDRVHTELSAVSSVSPSAEALTSL